MNPAAVHRHLPMPLRLAGFTGVVIAAAGPLDATLPAGGLPCEARRQRSEQP